jgi:hypothetical protein
MGISDRAKLFEEAKVKASILLKDLRSDSPERNLTAAVRLGKISQFADLSVDEIVAAKDRVRRKHALAVIAAERGFSSWTALKDHCNPERPKTPEIFDSARLFNGPRATFLNRWFVDYGQARDSLAERGGYLFPYRDQYFICEAGFVEALGLDPYDPDWERIGWNCVEPADKPAWNRLVSRL